MGRHGSHGWYKPSHELLASALVPHLFQQSLGMESLLNPFRFDQELVDLTATCVVIIQLCSCRWPIWSTTSLNAGELLLRQEMWKSKGSIF